MAELRPTTSPRRRSRLAALVGLLIVMASVGAAVALGLDGATSRAPSSGSNTSSSTSSAGPSKPQLAKLVGQMLMGRMTGTSPSPALIQRIRRGQLGGLIIFPDNVSSNEELRATIARLQREARAGGNPPLLISTDQEGGTVMRFPNGPPGMSARQLAATGDRKLVFRAGRATGTYLRGLGINVDLAPVLDAPSTPDNFLGSRAFDARPQVVSTYGKAFLRGLQTANVAATAKHFPGLGTAGANTDLGRVVITTPEHGLRWRYRPFAEAVRSGVRLMMVSNAAYRSLDPSGRPAALSRPIVTKLLRDRLGFSGVVITDAFGTPAPASFRNGPALAIDAGVDMLLYSGSEQSSDTAFRTLVRAARSGEISRAQLDAANTRIAELKRWLERP